jgi:hypothetical protein
MPKNPRHPWSSPRTFRRTKALAERQSAAIAKVEDQNRQDLVRTTEILDNELRKKLHDREAIRKAERARWRREHPKRKGFIEAVQRRLSPRSAAAKDAAEKKEWKDLLARHQKERADQAAQPPRRPRPRHRRPEATPRPAHPRTATQEPGRDRTLLARARRDTPPP